ncbi:serine hydrolase domain-containing protein [Emticicia agri]|uniref:Class A beta-lactamase-related serine hydrolase n=1 Tax=Emticicia agri TaxID=2492393 RepID=A0A4Q5LUJ3_9BACT|nr:serine hydrolase domain-containing protein [Emticicia agri]RYU93348.1 class A beta-lactamase-related serine hydrolase [Emticicia agri]
MIKRLKVTTLIGFIAIFAGMQAKAQAPEQIKLIDQYIQQNIDKNHIPGLSIAIVNKNQVVFSKGYGKDGNNRAIISSTPFAIASLSKAFTAMAVMQLVEAGKINLDTPVKNYIPTFQMADSRANQITVRQFLNQTSGLSDVVYPELSFKQQPASTMNTIDNLKDVELDSKPGEKFHYHNPNYHVMAHLVEVVSREKFSDYMQKHIFTPLQMTHSANYHSTMEFQKHLAQGNIFVFGQPVKLNEPNWFIEGSAGMVSTTSDLAKWLMMYLNKGEYKGQKLLSEKGIETMFSPPANSSYGLGWFIDPQKNVSHSGVLWTYQAEQMILTKEGYGIVILFNSGINAFQDYHVFMQGVSHILTNQEANQPVMNDSIYELLMATFILLTLLLTFMRFRNMKTWVAKHRLKPSWVVTTENIIRLLPLAFLVLIPNLLTLLSHRVLSWERIFLMAPSVIIWLGVVAFCNLLIVVVRVVNLRKRW